MELTMQFAPSGTNGAAGGPGIAASGCRVRQILERVGDKWPLFVIGCLGDGPKRFTPLKHSVEGISQRMLTVTLRGLERDGIVSRTMYAVMPPRVDYELTPLGRTLLDAVGALLAWADVHLDEVDAARAAYDARAATPASNDVRQQRRPPATTSASNDVRQQRRPPATTSASNDVRQGEAARARPPATTSARARPPGRGRPRLVPQLYPPKTRQSWGTIVREAGTVDTCWVIHRLEYCSSGWRGGP
jgi:DNA-binding HxlR family transcriptional regulator